MNTLLIEPTDKSITATPKTPCEDRLKRRAIISPQARILYVDDDDEIRGLGQEVLERKGYQVDTAADGREGLEALLDGHHQLLITDNKMPRLTGLELVVQARKAGLRLPIVMTSGFADLEQLPNQVRADITALLPKPFVTADLVSNVARILNRNSSMWPGEQALNSIVRTFCATQSYRHWGINE